MPMRTRVSLVTAIIILTLLPSIVMLVVTAIATGMVQAAATWASIPAIVGIFAAVAAGRRMAIIVAIVMGFLAPLSIVAGLSAVSGAALMAILCMALGRMARFGLHKSTLLVPVGIRSEATITSGSPALGRAVTMRTVQSAPLVKGPILA